MTNILFLSGSVRKDSLNKALARSAHSIAERIGIDSTFIDLKDYELPIYDGDLEAEHGVPKAAKELKELFIKHDAFFIASPEYNGSFSPLLKNTIDWISRPNNPEETPLIAFKNKCAAISAASPGRLGGIRGLAMLRVLLANVGVTVIGAEHAIASAHDVFDDKGVIKDHRHIVAVESIVEKLHHMVNKT